MAEGVLSVIMARPAANSKRGLVSRHVTLVWKWDVASYLLRNGREFPVQTAHHIMRHVDLLTSPVTPAESVQHRVLLPVVVCAS